MSAVTVWSMTVLTVWFNPQVSWDVSIGGLTRAHKDLSTYLNSYFNKFLSQLPVARCPLSMRSWVSLPNPTFSSSLTIMSSLINCGWMKNILFHSKLRGLIIFPPPELQKNLDLIQVSLFIRRNESETREMMWEIIYDWAPTSTKHTTQCWVFYFILCFHSSQWKCSN